MENKYRLFVYAADPSYNLNVEGVYRAEDKLIVLADFNPRQQEGCWMQILVWSGVEITIQHQIDLPVEWYIKGEKPYDCMSNYQFIDESDVGALINGLDLVQFQQVPVESDEEFLAEYNHYEEIKTTLCNYIRLVLVEKELELRNSYQNEGKDIENIDMSSLDLERNIDLILKQDRTQNRQKTYALSSEGEQKITEFTQACLANLEGLIKFKPTISEKIGHFISSNRNGFYYAGAAVLGASVAAAGLALGL